MQKTGWAAIVLGLIAIAGIFVHQRWDQLTASEGTRQAVPASPETPDAEEPPPIRHPIPEPASEPAAADAPGADEDESETREPLPPLAESDKPVRADLKTLLGGGGLPEFLVPERLIEHTVVTIENLDRKAIPLRYRPVEHVSGQPAVEAGDGGRHYLTADNAARYDAYVDALTAVDAAPLAALYVRYYPLFQQAYEAMGYPDRYFNDRLVAVIDHLLATPAVEYPIPVVRPDVLWEFANPDLEERSWGQKTLIRMGPGHMATVKAELRALRAEIADREPADDAMTENGGEDGGDPGGGQAGG